MLFQRISRARTCPACKSADVYRVKRTGISVKVVCRIVNLRPYWCSACDTFFLAPKPPNAVRIPESYGIASPQSKGSNHPHPGNPPH